MGNSLVCRSPLLPGAGSQPWARAAPAAGSLPHLTPGNSIFQINLIRLQARQKEIKIASCTNKS